MQSANLSVSNMKLKIELEESGKIEANLGGVNSAHKHSAPIVLLTRSS